MSIVGKSQSGRACAEPASRPSAPRSRGGAKRRALTSVSTRTRCWLDDAAGDHDILRSTRVQFLSVPRARQHKGGTALRFKLGLSRPSTDLDFEGDRRVSVRSAVRHAIAADYAGAGYRVGRALFWRGTVQVSVWHSSHGDRLDLKVDYRRTGTRQGMPARVPLELCERVDGVNIYADAELVRRKLATVVGVRPRRKARDLYDAGWLVTHHPLLVGAQDRDKLQAGLAQIIITPHDVAEMRDRLREEAVTGRVDAALV